MAVRLPPGAVKLFAGTAAPKRAAPPVGGSAPSTPPPTGVSAPSATPVAVAPTATAAPTAAAPVSLPNLAVEAVFAIHNAAPHLTFHQVGDTGTEFECPVDFEGGSFRVHVTWQQAQGVVTMNGIFPIKLRQGMFDEPTITQIMNAVATQSQGIIVLNAGQDSQLSLFTQLPLNPAAQPAERASASTQRFTQLLQFMSGFWWQLVAGVGGAARQSRTPPVTPPTSVPITSSPVGSVAVQPALMQQPQPQLQPQAQPGQVSGRPEIINSASVQLANTIGNGIMGPIFMGRVAGYPDAVVVKEWKGKALNEAQMNKLQEEFASIQGLKHPNLLPFVAICVNPLYLIVPKTELCFSVLMEQIKGAPLPKIVEILNEISEAVKYLHASGVVHGRIKPENIFVDGAGRALLAEYGMNQTRKNVLGLKLPTGPVAIYAAPEVFMGKSPTAGTDVFSLGMLLYQLAMPHAVVTPPVVPERLPFDGAPSAGLQDLIRACLARDPSKRISCMEFQSALQRL